jgi:hypothetical protein
MISIFNNEDLGLSSEALQRKKKEYELKTQGAWNFSP